MINSISIEPDLISDMVRDTSSQGSSMDDIGLGFAYSIK